VHFLFSFNWREECLAIWKRVQNIQIFLGQNCKKAVTLRWVLVIVLSEVVAAVAEAGRGQGAPEPAEVPQVAQVGHSEPSTQRDDEAPRVPEVPAPEAGGGEVLGDQPVRAVETGAEAERVADGAREPGAPESSQAPEAPEQGVNAAGGGRVAPDGRGGQEGGFLADSEVVERQARARAAEEAVAEGSGSQASCKFKENYEKNSKRDINF
jgi:hypothetical protein